MGANTLTTLTPSRGQTGQMGAAGGTGGYGTMSSIESVNAQLGTWSAPEARPHAPRSVPRGGPSISPLAMLTGINYATLCPFLCRPCPVAASAVPWHARWLGLAQ